MRYRIKDKYKQVKRVILHSGDTETEQTKTQGYGPHPSPWNSYRSRRRRPGHGRRER